MPIEISEDVLQNDEFSMVTDSNGDLVLEHKPTGGQFKFDSTNNSWTPVQGLAMGGSDISNAGNVDVGQSLVTQNLEVTGSTTGVDGGNFGFSEDPNSPQSSNNGPLDFTISQSDPEQVHIQLFRDSIAPTGTLAMRINGINSNDYVDTFEDATTSSQDKHILASKNAHVSVGRITLGADRRTGREKYIANLSSRRTNKIATGGELETSSVPINSFKLFIAGNPSSAVGLTARVFTTTL
jgi:hypothetical protein